MEFTDDMISRVLVALEQQQQTAARQHTVAQQQAAAPVLWQASGQRPKVVRPPTGKERSGQQAAIALLVADAAPRGKHFKVAASASGGSEGATIEKFSSHKPAMQGHGKHARVEKTPFRRVS
jgi:hypothetical protein